MTDVVVSEFKDNVEVEKDVEKTASKEVCQKKTDTKEKNGDCVVDEKAENDEDKNEEENDKLKENGHSKENGVAEKEETESKDATDGNEVCGLKRKSDIGAESGDAAVESSEKKQKLDEESVVAANGDC